MNHNIIRLALLAIPLFLVMTLSACNTIKGVGDDMSAAGDALSEEADEKKTY